MITGEKWLEFISKWKAVGPVYQVPRRSKERLEHFCKHCIPFLKDKRVLEIGANAGIFGYCISQEAESYVGVEPANKVRDPSKKKPPKTDFFKQLEITHKEMKNAKIFNETITEYCKHPEDTNAFVACFALYHFMDHELKALDEKVFPNCDTVIIQNRNQKRPTPHNSYEFWRTKKVTKYFKKRGFQVVDIISSSRNDGTQLFDEIIMVSK